jgi:hypothetical protein
MRALLLALVLPVVACTPEIVSGSYKCGPNASCPEDQTCNGEDNICVTAAAQPFSCEPDRDTEPDDTADKAFSVGAKDCTSVASILDSCMDEGDSADWVSFSTNASCSDISVDVRVTFPTAFEELGLELWDVAANERVAVNAPCEFTGEPGDELRCLKGPLQAGRQYAIQVLPTGEGTCDGRCAYNRYTLRMQISEAR